MPSNFRNEHIRIKVMLVEVRPKSVFVRSADDSETIHFGRSLLSGKSDDMLSKYENRPFSPIEVEIAIAEWWAAENGFD